MDVIIEETGNVISLDIIRKNNDFDYENWFTDDYFDFVSDSSFHDYGVEDDKYHTIWFMTEESGEWWNKYCSGMQEFEDRIENIEDDEKAEKISSIQQDVFMTDLEDVPGLLMKGLDDVFGIEE